MSLVDAIKAIQRAVGAEPDGIFGPRTAVAVWKDLNREAAEAAKAGAKEDAILDERTIKTIATLDHAAQFRFVDFTLLAKATAATYGCDYVAISGHRTWKEQDELYLRVPKVTNAKGGYSNHNFGIAVDFGVFRGKVYLDASNPELAQRVHAACAAHAKACGLGWGGDWKGKLKDSPHYEVSTGLSLAAKRKLYNERGSVL